MTTSRTLPPFHLAIPVDDINAAREFYGKVLGFEQGGPTRAGSTGTWAGTRS